MVDRDRLKAQLVLEEGLRLTPYVDTENNWTIGVGYNITARGWEFLEQAIGRKVAPADGLTEKASITGTEAFTILNQDIARVERGCIIEFQPYLGLDEVRQLVCCDMAFNMGHKALGFRNTIIAIIAKDWETAARELCNSKWHGEVTKRCDRLARMILTGLYPSDVTLL